MDIRHYYLKHSNAIVYYGNPKVNNGAHGRHQLGALLVLGDIVKK